MIIVTGGSGKVGRACVRDLMEHGYDVTSIDMLPPPGQTNPPTAGNVRYSRADVTDFGEAMAALSMIDERVAKVTGVVGGSAMKPTPISEKEVQAILHQIQEGVEKPRPKVLFEVGEAVRVKDGPFADFHGNVEDVNYDKNKLRVSVTIFGRSTPVELDFGQVEKA